MIRPGELFNMVIIGIVRYDASSLLPIGRLELLSHLCLPFTSQVTSFLFGWFLHQRFHIFLFD